MFSNQSVDGRADLYSLGIIAYQALSGSVPFDGPTPMGLYKQAHTQAEPQQRPHVSRPMAYLVHRLLEKDPALRFENASELEAALAQAGKGHGSESKGGQDSTCRPFCWRGLDFGGGVRRRQRVQINCPMRRSKNANVNR